MTLAKIAQKRDELEARVLNPDYKVTERDVAESAELVEQYIDELERLENTVTVKPALTDINAIADQILSRWYPNG